MPGTATSWVTPTKPTCPPGRVAWSACIIDSCVPTASTTEWAPSPSVSSLIRSTPASPRSSTMSVAPNSRARSCRSSWRLIAMIRSAPSCFAASTARSPTAPSPTTATVLPGAASAATAANQPVPSTSEAARRLGIRSSAGTSGVATSVPSASGTQIGLCPQRAHRQAVDARTLVFAAADRAGVVGGPERADNELAGPDGGDVVTNLFDDADVFVAHRHRPCVVAYTDAAVRPEVGAADTGRADPDDRVRRVDDARIVALLDAHVARAVHDRAAHQR